MIKDVRHLSDPGAAEVGGPGRDRASKRLAPAGRYDTRECATECNASFEPHLRLIRSSQTGVASGDHDTHEPEYGANPQHDIHCWPCMSHILNDISARCTRTSHSNA